MLFHFFFQFVAVYGDSQLRSVVDDHVIPRNINNTLFGFNSTPGGKTDDIRKELLNSAPKIEPHCVILQAGTNDVSRTTNVDKVKNDYKKLITTARVKFPNSMVNIFS